MLFFAPNLLRLRSFPIFFVSSSRRYVSYFSKFVFSGGGDIVMQSAFVGSFVQGTVHSRFVTSSSIIWVDPSSSTVAVSLQRLGK